MKDLGESANDIGKVTEIVQKVNDYVTTIVAAVEEQQLQQRILQIILDMLPWLSRMLLNVPARTLLYPRK